MFRSVKEENSKLTFSAAEVAKKMVVIMELMMMMMMRWGGVLGLMVEQQRCFKNGRKILMKMKLMESKSACVCCFVFVNCVGALWWEQYCCWGV